MVQLAEAVAVGNKFNIDWNVISAETFKQALEVELEHKDVTHGDMDMTARIAIAHLKEYPDYYSRLNILEHDAELYWSVHKKPSLVLPHKSNLYYFIIGILIVLIFFIIITIIKNYICPSNNFRPRRRPRYYLK